jgi:hypothetical protein
MPPLQPQFGACWRMTHSSKMAAGMLPVSRFSWSLSSSRRGKFANSAGITPVSPLSCLYWETVPKRQRLRVTTRRLARLGGCRRWKLFSSSHKRSSNHPDFNTLWHQCQQLAARGPRESQPQSRHGDRHRGLCNLNMNSLQAELASTGGGAHSKLCRLHFKRVLNS